MMVLYNPTDDSMAWPAGKNPPLVNGPEEIYFPPQFFFFRPGEEQEVPDHVADVLIEHLGPRGLVAYKFGQAIDKDELRIEGRKQWFEWLKAQVVRHQMLNEEQRNNGRVPIRPNRNVLRHAEKYKQLSAGEFADTVMDIPRPAGGAMDVLKIDGGGMDDAALAAAAARGRDRDEAFEAPEA
jgi:hypothetical protein